MPPASSAFDLYFVPKIFPIFTPANEIKNVQTPIIDAADTICTFKNANVILLQVHLYLLPLQA